MQFGTETVTIFLQTFSLATVATSSIVQTCLTAVRTVLHFRSKGSWISFQNFRNHRLAQFHVLNVISTLQTDTSIITKHTVRETFTVKLETL